MGGVVSSVFGEKPKAGKPFAGAQFQPFSYTSVAGTAKGEKDGTGFEFSQELSPELQALYGAGIAQAQPFLSQYLTQAQAPVVGFDFTADPRAREAEIFQQQAELLRPELLRQQIGAQERMFGSGRLGLRLSGEAVGAGEGAGMVSPDAYGLGLAQSRAIAELAPQARQMAQAEQQQAFTQAQEAYRLNQAAQQQQLANLLGGFQGAFGTAQNILGMEQGLIGQAAGLEQARASAGAQSAQAGAALAPRGGSGGLFGAIGGGLGGALGQATGSWLTGGFVNPFTSPMSFGQSGSIWGSGGASYAAAPPMSDVRLKKNINLLGKLGNFNIYSWDWNEKGIELGAINMPTVGVLAQEVLEVMPEAIITGDDGYYRVDYNKVFEGAN